ncbi:MAG: hypothetical protein NTY03_00190 [Candidatus Bathyarchaeota archaeon]|nr:hypothetical protein [Candidatus Bathyarchaeota archaeon]
MSSSRRRPSEIALALFNCIDAESGRASKWGLIKILGNESQFHYWVEEFLIQERFIEEKIESNRSFYLKTANGELFHRLLKNGNIMMALLKVSGKKLRRI